MPTRINVRSEFSKVELGDVRLEHRLAQIVEQVSRAPAQSFPTLMASTAEREAAYRFFNNEAVAFEEVLAGHVGATVERCATATAVRVVHDTTTLTYSGDREGMGIIEDDARGFFGHFSLAVSADERRIPLGVLGLHPFIHAETAERRKLSRSEQVRRSQKMAREEKESSRWEREAIKAQTLLGAGVKAVHVMDREADDFTLLAELAAHGLRFVVRGSGERYTAIAGERVRETLASQEGQIFRTVSVNRRSAKKARVTKQAARSERKVAMHIRWAGLTLPRPLSCNSPREEVALNVVQVFEAEPPEGETAVEWYLFTNEAVTSLEEASAVVDHYRARWVIEEYFKSLKTGCAVEKRQLCSYEALLRALAVFVPVAWQLLALRTLAARDPDAPAERHLGATGLKVLRVLLAEWRRDYHLPAQPTLREAMLAIAGIGGHIPNNGEPGWQVLGRGFLRFTEAESFWRAATCDQS